MGVKLEGKKPYEFGLIFLKNHYHPATPEMRNRTMTIPGMSGEWDFGSEWGSRPFSLPFAIIEYDKYELQRKLRAFVAFLMDAYGKPREIKLSFDYEPDKYYSVKARSRVDVERAIHTGRLDLPLIAHDPAAYAEANAYDPIETYMYDVGYVQKSNMISNYSGKVAGSTVENPNKVGVKSASTLQGPSTFTDIANQTYVNGIRVLDGSYFNDATYPAGNMIQECYSFNVLAIVEKNYGTIPADTTEGKLTWLRNNIQRFIGEWSGRGSSPTGNKASFTMWDATASAWHTSRPTNTTNTISKIPWTVSNPAFMDANGWVHYLAFADPSDGVTPSTLHTDYVQLSIDLKTYWLETNPNTQPQYQYDIGLMHYNPTEFQWTNPREYSGVHNYSSIETPLILEIEGTVENPEITNTLTGETLILPTLWSDKMTIDTGKFSIKVGEVSKFVDGDFFKLQPGDNSLLFTGDNPNATVRYNWKHKFL